VATGGGLLVGWIGSVWLLELHADKNKKHKSRSILILIFTCLGGE
jgi:biotin transporter BioY